jgi:hypothetical protein
LVESRQHDSYFYNVKPVFMAMSMLRMVFWIHTSLWWSKYHSFHSKTKWNFIISLWMKSYYCEKMITYFKVLHGPGKFTQLTLSFHLMHCIWNSMIVLLFQGVKTSVEHNLRIVTLNHWRYFSWLFKLTMGLPSRILFYPL